MAKIEYKNDITRAFEEAEGSDGRLNVSSRSDSRAYYNSRDMKQTYSVVYDHQGAVAGEQSFYLKNTSETKTMVVVHAGLNSAENSRIKMCFVSGTAAGGAVITPTNTNKASSNKAAALVMEGASGNAITGLTDISCIDFAAVQANGHEEFLLGDTIRLGQDDAVSLKYVEGTTGDFFGVVGLYFE